VAHHFANLEQQRDAHILCMWMFLGSEILFFGALFTAFGMMRFQTPHAFGLAAQHLSETMGGINTAVLLASSFTMALSVWAAQTGQRTLLLVFLAGTMVFGTGFLAIKATEWYGEYREHLLPGPEFVASVPHGAHLSADEVTQIDLDGKKIEVVTGNDGRGMQLFFVFYFVITGLHGLHMIVGLGVLIVQFILVARSSFGIDDYTPIELSGLYWHFVDVVWIFVFPLLYLLRH
jgi:cytochrome c oxidase subunit 3